MDVATTNLNTAGQTYIETIASSSSLSSLMRSVTNAEGSYDAGAFSVHASATFSYMHDHSLSTNSITYYLGQTQVVKQESFNPQSSTLKLTDSAMSILRSDPDHFIRSYGTHFIKEVDYGITFAGSLSLYAKEFSDAASLSAFAEIDAKDLFFSFKSSEKYSSAYSSYHSSLDMEITAQYTGATGVVKACSDCIPSKPDGLNTEYQSWLKLVSGDNYAKSAPKMRMLYVPYAQVPQIAQFLSALPSSETTGNGKYAAFFLPPVNPQVAESLNYEAMQTSFVVNALAHAKEYGCYIEDSQFKSGIDQQLSAAQAHYTAFENLTYEEMLDIQNHVGSWSTFLGKALQMEQDYKNLMASSTECINNCAVFCAGPGNKGEKVILDGLTFQSTVSDYIQDPMNSKAALTYGNVIGCWDISLMT
ncbi:MAG: hypothetical protein SGILL_002210 [Bacillariaceae sp.]